MQMRKGNEGQGTARSASKSPGKKLSGDETSAANENTAANQETTRQQPEGGDQNLVQHAKQATGEIVNQVQERAGSQFNRQKEAAASELSQVANAVRRIRESLPGEDGGTLVRFAGEYGDKAAASIERLSNYIREQDPKQLLDDVQKFGRRRPALLLGGAFLLGFAGARLIKSSMDTGSQQPTAGNAL